MRKTSILTIFLLIGSVHAVSAQKISSTYFGNYFLADSASTLLIPVLYDAKLFSSGKMELQGGYYTNIIIYDFKTDSMKRLFDKDTYIVSFESGVHYNKRTPQDNMSSEYIFYKVCNVDRNKNERIDPHDPVILYVSDKHGNNLTALTSPEQNVVDIQILDKQNFVMVKIQRDTDQDNRFEPLDDSDYYYVRLDLKTRHFGRRIELD